MFDIIDKVGGGEIPAEVYSKDEVDALIAGIDAYSTGEVDTLITNIDTYSTGEVDTLITGVDARISYLESIAGLYNYQNVEGGL